MDTAKCLLSKDYSMYKQFCLPTICQLYAPTTSVHSTVQSQKCWGKKLDLVFMPNVTSYSFLSLSGWNRKRIRVVILILYKLSNTINGYLTLVGKRYLSSIVESFVISTIRPIFTWKFATSKRSTCGHLKQWADSWSLSFISPWSVKGTL